MAGRARRRSGWNIIGRDFNARTGSKGGGKGEEEKEEEEEIRRKSKNKKINGEGRKLIEKLEKVGWGILNESTRGDEEGEFTYTGGRGESVIDYVIGEKKVRDKMVLMEMEECVESDHYPLIVTLRDGERRDKKEKKGKVERKKGKWMEGGGG